jgi:predicted DNA-binding transcriptional regulator YafY
MDTFARRLALWRLLAGATEPVALRALAERFGVSKNTIRRDVDALSRAGVPVAEERRGQVILYFVSRPEGS